MEYYVYILTNYRRGTLYVGMTSNLPKRIYQHKAKMVEGFTEKHDLTNLVYFEIFDSSLEAIKREKQMKKWNRTWKIELVENNNSEWKDLYESIL